MLLSLLEIRNRMLNCKPTAVVSVEFCGDDAIRLGWAWEDTSGLGHTYHIDVHICQIRPDCRSFERQMHKAKRYMKYQAEV